MSKPTYERPGIVRHQMGWMNKFGRQQATRPLSHVDGKSLTELVREYGSPLFVFSQRTMISRYHDLYSAFARRYPRVRLAWSYKTNYLEAICRTFHREGAWAEVVSPFEYEKALRSGVSPDHIHWNGPYKPLDRLETAIAGGSILHIDSYDEMVKIEQAARNVGKHAKVALRINMAIDGLDAWSRFGLNLESGQAEQAVKRVAMTDGMDLVGLHTHIGTFIQDPNAHGIAAGKLADLANKILKDYGIKLSFIDLGGGFASPNSLKGQYLTGEQATPAMSRYAESICDALGKLNYAPKELPTLVLETGRALVDESGFLVSTVHATKRLPDGQRAIVIDAGVNVLFTSFWYRHEVLPVLEARGIPEPTVMYGPLCMNIDVVRDSVPLPPLSAGDRVVFKNVGAYNVTQWMQFIMLRPAVVMIGADGEVACIRRAETTSDLVSHEEVPKWLG